MNDFDLERKFLQIWISLKFERQGINAYICCYCDAVLKIDCMRTLLNVLRLALEVIYAYWHAIQYISLVS